MSNIVDYLVSVFGSQKAVGKLAGVAQSSVAEWKTKNEVPTPRAKKLLAAAKEQGKPLSAEQFLTESAATAPQDRAVQ